MRRNKENKTVYLAEVINDSNSWEWYEVYDSEKWTIPEIFKIIISDNENILSKDVILKTNSIKRLGSLYTHNDYDVRVWEVYI